MAGSSSSDGSSELYTNTTAPSGTDYEDNATYIVTDDGTPSGVPVEMWKFDADTQTWLNIPLGGDECPAPMTRAALLSLVGSLSKDCHYVITDYNRNNVGAASILLHAVDADTLSMNVHVSTLHDNMAWKGTYDINANRIESLHDNLGNDVYGQAAVDAFPWGVAAVTENEVREGLVFYTGGTVTENFLSSTARMTISGGTVAQNTIEHSANVTVSGGTFQDNTVRNDATVTVSSGSNFENMFGTSTTYTQAGTGYIRYSKLDGNSTIINGNTNITNTTFEGASAFNTTGSTGNVSSSTFGYASVTAQNIASLTFTQVSMDSASIVSANDAARLYLYRSSATAGGRYLVSAGASLDCSYSSVQNYGYIQATAGVFLCNYSKASGLGYFSHQSTGSNRVERCEARAQSNMRFTGTSTGGRMYYCTTDNSATIYQAGTSTSCYHYNCTASSSSQMYITDSVNARHYYNSATGFSYIRSYGGGAGQSIMYYCTAHSRGYVDHDTIGARIRFYAVNSTGQSIARHTGGTANANLYYSTFAAYYYAYLALTGGTRTALHGYGRQTFSGMPSANGTGTRNWT